LEVLEEKIGFLGFKLKDGRKIYVKVRAS